MGNGLSAHIDSIHRMMQRANREDGFLSDACTKSISLENLSAEVIEEMAIAPCKNNKDCKCKKGREA